MQKPILRGWQLFHWVAWFTPHIRDQFIMMDMTTMSAGMTLAMGLACLIILAFVVLGIAAFIKYLRS
jgi:hypothetical protein